MPVKVVDISEGLPTHLASMVLLDWFTGLLDCLCHWHNSGSGTAARVSARGRCSDC